MNDAFIIGAYWGSRAEPLILISKKILQTLTRLVEIDEQYINLFELGVSRKNALEKKITLDIETIKALCIKNLKRGEFDENGYAKNGFCFSVWTGHKNEESSNVSFNVGEEFKVLGLSNCCVLSIPFKGKAKERHTFQKLVIEIMNMLIEIWNPDYAVLTSNNLRSRLNVGNKIGWVTYHKFTKQIPKDFDKICYKEFNNGCWFYPCLDNNYEESLIDELIKIKQYITL